VKSFGRTRLFNEDWMVSYLLFSLDVNIYGDVGSLWI
jgi:hypothetical protein